MSFHFSLEKSPDLIQDLPDLGREDDIANEDDGDNNEVEDGCHEAGEDDAESR